MRYLITGAGGMLGSDLVEALAGEDVVAPAARSWTSPTAMRFAPLRPGSTS